MAIVRGSSPFVCDQCSKEFNQKQSLIRHFNNIHGEEGPTFTCDVCCKAANTKSDLARHIAQHQNRIHVFKCQLCPHDFVCKSGLRCHQAVVHEGRRFACDTCGKLYGHKSELLSHIAAVHQQQRPYECIVCGDRFSLRSTLKSHTAARHRQKMLECDECGAKFGRKMDVTNHIRSVHLKLRLFSCVECQVKCSNNSHLNEHIRIVHKKLVVVCDLCSKSFTTKRHLAGHCFAAHL